MTLLIFFILGLIIGSFLNVLVYRLHMAEDLFFDRSKCPHCEHLIRWYDNIPVLSFVLLKAKCRDCQKKISWQYPLVEISTGLVFVLAGHFFFIFDDPTTWLTTAYYLVILASLIVILVYDSLYMEIPSLVLWFSVALAVAFGLYVDWNWAVFAGSQVFGSQLDILNTKIYSGVLAAFLAFLFFFSLSAFSREKWMGMGDAYLVILLGLILGFPQILLALFLAFFLGALCGTIMIFAGKKQMKSRLPFAPFLIIGTLVALFFYAPIINWYWSLLW